MIRGVLQLVLKHFQTVICIDDGSSDASVAEIAKTKAILIKHPINMGQGAALQTGIQFALRLPAIEYCITFDADGQHRVADALAMLRELQQKHLDIILGSRFLGATTNLPWKRKLVLKMAVVFSQLTTGLHLTDAHNGLRAFNRRAAVALRITMPGMAHASEILSIIKVKRLSYEEFPVTIEYTDYSVAKGQSLFNAINILFDLALKGKAR